MCLYNPNNVKHALKPCGQLCLHMSLHESTLSTCHLQGQHAEVFFNLHLTIAWLREVCSQQLLDEQKQG